MGARTCRRNHVHYNKPLARNDRHLNTTLSTFGFGFGFVPTNIVHSHSASLMDVKALINGVVIQHNQLVLEHDECGTKNGMLT
jgi:hypothetical protein